MRYHDGKECDMDLVGNFNPTTNRIVCATCGKLVLKYRMKHHERIHLEPKHHKYFHCSYEGCTYKNQILYETKHHIQNYHIKDEKFKCPVCDKRFSALRCVNKHVKTHSQERKFECTFPGCGMKFKRSYALQTHKLRHSDLKPMKCELCEFSCRQRPSIDCHMKSQHGMVRAVETEATIPGVKKTITYVLAESVGKKRKRTKKQ